MRTVDIARRTAVGAVAVALGTAAGAAAPNGPAHAGGYAPVRVEEASDSDGSVTKVVTATCPGARSVFAAGARIVNGNGGVVLTAMEPDAELTTVTVTATARTGHAGAWSVVAYATCDSSTSPPVRATATVGSASTVEVSCPGGTRLVGTGFRFDGPVDQTYVDEVAFGPGLRTVRVHTGGTAEPADLTAVGVCKEPTQPTGPPGVRVEATSGYDGTWPKTVVTADAGPDAHVYGVGARVTGAGQFFLSAIVPSATLRQAGAEAVRASQVPGAVAARAGAAEDGSGSVTVSAIEMAAFH
ncbi:hypothetical protein [Micromonospora sp. WMMD1155]|uniref:hypothetical protein n=1 Tax=Micromonospora sp. WMMD1155 TaxID=3016094 RepID=UPI002499BA25|nr:hypothetical protein [Micromonospora sp. WMMD1155]WFE54478.1 hypothetical protein O7617_30870 [Micromonospora sp. WMMD1155]